MIVNFIWGYLEHLVPNICCNGFIQVWLNVFYWTMNSWMWYSSLPLWIVISCRCISWYIMKSPDGYWNTFLSSLHFMIDHEVSCCTLKYHERSWWLLNQLWCIMNYGKILKDFVKNHDRSWFAPLHFREVPHWLDHEKCWNFFC